MGKRPVPKQVISWSRDLPAAHSMRRGCRQVIAWIGQMATPYERLSGETKISIDRLHELDAGAR